MRNSNRPFIPVNDYNEINVCWNEWPVRFAKVRSATRVSSSDPTRVKSNYTCIYQFILRFYGKSNAALVFMLNIPIGPRVYTETHYTVNSRNITRIVHIATNKCNTCFKASLRRSLVHSLMIALVIVS